jgi:hypothetical protein
MVIVALALSIAFQASSGTAADYFPLDPGEHWVYTCDKDGALDELSYTAQRPVKIGGALASPLLMQEGTQSTTLYYLTDPDTVWLLGVDKDNPYPSPHAVLRTSGSWKGDYMERDPVNMDASAKGIGKRSVLGQSRDVLEVTTKLVFGNTKVKLIIVEHAEYAKGLGLIRFEMDQTQGRQKQHELLTLKSFEPGSKG